MFKEIPEIRISIILGLFKSLKLYVLHDLGERGSPISTNMLVNKVDTTRCGAILCQHGATASTELLEVYFR